MIRLSFASSCLSRRDDRRRTRDHVTCCHLLCHCFLFRQQLICLHGFDFCLFRRGRRFSSDGHLHERRQAFFATTGVDAAFLVSRTVTVVDAKVVFGVTVQRIRRCDDRDIDIEALTQLLWETGHLRLHAFMSLVTRLRPLFTFS